MLNPGDRVEADKNATQWNYIKGAVSWGAYWRRRLDRDSWLTARKTPSGWTWSRFVAEPAPGSADVMRTGTKVATGEALKLEAALTAADQDALAATNLGARQ